MAEKIDKTDLFLQQLAKRVDSAGNLRSLAIQLGIENHIVAVAIRDKDGITEAVRSVLNTWTDRTGVKGVDLVEKLRKAFREMECIGPFNEVHEKVFGSDEDTTQASPSKTKQKRQEKASPPRNEDHVDSSVCLAQPPDDGKSLEACLGEDAPRIMSYPHKGKIGRAVIISNDFTYLPEKDKKKYLEGYKADVLTIKETLTKIGFEEIETHHNLSKSDTLTVLKKEAMKKYDDYSCACCFILSHGNEESIETKGGELLTIRELTGCFSNDNLKGKPKLFFIQACRGGGFQEPSPPDQESPVTTAETSGSAKYPMEADIFEFYASPFGYVSFVDRERGSYFIQSLCHVLKDFVENDEQSKINILEIATNTNRMISNIVTKYQKNKDDKQKTDCLQVSMINSTMTRNFFLKKK